MLDTLVYLVHETSVWFEITTLLIPGHNDSDEEIEAECEWIRKELGPDVPLHFTAFHPDYKMTDLAPTPPETLTRARAIALRRGSALRLHRQRARHRGRHDVLPRLRDAVIERDWYRILNYRLTPEGRCPDCGTAIAGRFEAFRPFGQRRIPVRLANFHA